MSWFLVMLASPIVLIASVAILFVWGGLNPSKEKQH